MQIVGVGLDNQGALGVHTIDMWFSERRQAWIVERLDEQGDQIGTAYQCDTEEDAAVCLAEWLRTHMETHLVAPREATAAERRVLAAFPRRRAA